MSQEKSPKIPVAHEARPRLQLSSVQVLASALAAVTATVAGSFLGVNGTVIGAAIASVLTVTANAIYSHSLHRTGARVRSAPRGWRRLGTATTVLFVSVLALVTAVEVASGRPVSDLLRGKTGSGTTVFGASSSGSVLTNTATTTPQPPLTATVTRTVVPKVVLTTPTVTRTAPAVTVTPMPGATGSTAGPTPSPSGSTSGGPTP